MAVCPNCAKKMRDDFAYCRICGTKLSGENPGDFKTEMLNVFRHEDGFIYLFCDNGHQVILKAGSIDELALMANENKYPWEFRDKSKNSRRDVEMVKTPHFENDFLKASALKEPEVIPTSSTFKKAETKKDESYVPDFEVSRVVGDKPDSNQAALKKSKPSRRVFYRSGRNRQRPPKSDEFWQEKSQLVRQMSQKRVGEITERLAVHNMDKLLR